jgi:VCBS repeat-containing protein
MGMLLSQAVQASGPPPVILTQPLDQIVIKGGTAIFGVTVVSGTALSYRWFHVVGDENERINSAATGLLTITNVQNSDAGEYFCQVKNAGGQVETRHATLTILLNSPPTATDDTYTTPEDVPLVVPAAGVLANDTDPNNDALSAILVSNVGHGTLILNANGSFTYTPDTNYNGIDSFSYQVSDGGQTAGAPPTSITSGNVATVTINITSVNDPPVALPDSYSVFNNNTLTVPVNGVLANDTDAEGDPLSAVLVSDVAHGSLSLHPDGSFIYTPASNYVGADFFNYRAHDGLTPGASTTVSLTVLPDVRFDSVQMTVNGCQLQLSGPAGSNYVIFASSNLIDWSPIATNTAASGTLTYTDTSATTSAQRFYNAMLQ